jgi:hypothetical protein
LSVDHVTGNHVQLKRELVHVKIHQKKNPQLFETGLTM